MAFSRPKDENRSLVLDSEIAEDALSVHQPPAFLFWLDFHEPFELLTLSDGRSDIAQNSEV